MAADAAVSANSRGAVSATKAANPSNVYTVKFNKDVSKCSFTASPVGDATVQALGVVATPSIADSVNVDTGTAPGAFHLQVIC